MADQVLKQAGSGVAALIGLQGGKASLVVSVSKDLTPRINAVELVRAGVAELGGKGGGGRPDFAQGGGPDGARAERALEVIAEALSAEQAAAE
jgi:alanyl-tRNA synthetase